MPNTAQVEELKLPKSEIKYQSEKKKGLKLNKNIKTTNKITKTADDNPI